MLSLDHGQKEQAGPAILLSVGQRAGPTSTELRPLSRAALSVKLGDGAACLEGMSRLCPGATDHPHPLQGRSRGPSTRVPLLVRFPGKGGGSCSESSLGLLTPLPQLCKFPPSQSLTYPILPFALLLSKHLLCSCFGAARVPGTGDIRTNKVWSLP